MSAGTQLVVGCKCMLPIAIGVFDMSLPLKLLCVYVQVPGLVNVDFADVRAIMTNAGSSLMGQGRASGKARARDAALAAISSPLLDVGIERATGIVWNITGPSDLTLFEVRHALHEASCFPNTSCARCSWPTRGLRDSITVSGTSK